VTVRWKVAAHAVVRHDHGPYDVAQAVTVVAVVPTKDEAEREVARLQRLNADKGCTYFCTPTRYYPDGRRGEAS
jgi:hypothetical protein